MAFPGLPLPEDVHLTEVIAVELITSFLFSSVYNKEVGEVGFEPT